MFTLGGVAKIDGIAPDADSVDVFGRDSTPIYQAIGALARYSELDSSLAHGNELVAVFRKIVGK